MVEVDTFLTALYVMVADFHKSRPEERRRPGPDASLCESEIVTLAIFSRFSRFASERDWQAAKTAIFEYLETFYNPRAALGAGLQEPSRLRGGYK